MLCVLEGSDSSGKTTLAKALGGVYIHGLPYEGWVLEAHGAMLEAALRHHAAGAPVTVDRHWVSEFIYGPTFRRGAAYGDAEAERFDRTIRAEGVYVLCVPSDQEGQEKRWRDDQTSGKFEHFPEVRSVMTFYHDLARGNVAHPGDSCLDRYVRHGDFVSRGRCLVYDVDRDGRDVQAFCAKIRKEARR